MRPDDVGIGSDMRDRGGPVDGERSISGRACLPLLIVMFGIAALLVGSLAVVAAAVIR